MNPTATIERPDGARYAIFLFRFPANTLKFSPVTTGLPDRFSIRGMNSPSTVNSLDWAPAVIQLVTICHRLVSFPVQTLFHLQLVTACYPLTPVSLIHFLADRKKRFRPASFLILSNSRELKSEL